MLEVMDKDVMLTLRLSTDEHKAWKAAAEVEQMPLAAWIRRRCNGLVAVAPQTTFIHSTPAVKVPKKSKRGKS